MDLEWTARPELAAAVIAGWLTGVLVGLSLLTVLVIGLSREPRWWDRFPGLRVSLPVFGIIAANAMVFGWTLVGVLLGVAYAVLGTPGYSIAIVAVGMAAGAGYWIVRGEAWGMERRIVWISVGVATAAFAVVVPVVAEL